MEVVAAAREDQVLVEGHDRGQGSPEIGRTLGFGFFCTPDLPEENEDRLLVRGNVISLKPRQDLVRVGVSLNLPLNLDTECMLGDRFEKSVAKRKRRASAEERRSSWV